MRCMMYLCKFRYILYIYWKDILFFQSSKKERVGLVVVVWRREELTTGNSKTQIWQML